MTNIVIGAMDLLQTAGVGTKGAKTGWGIYGGREPDDPDTTVTVFPTGGHQSSNPHWLLDFPTLQVRVRGAPGKWEDVYNKAIEVKDALLGLPSQTISGDRWVSVTMPGDLIGIGKDSNDRDKFTLNFNLIIEPGSGTNRIAL